MIKIRFLLRSFLLSCLLLLSSCNSLPKFLVSVPDNPPSYSDFKNVKVVLVLGGGGSKSIAHLGALEVLEKNGIPIDLIVGTSAGSVIGALYADTPSVKVLKEKLMGVKKWDILDPSLSNAAQMFFTVKGPIIGHAYQKLLLKYIATRNIESLKIPLICVTTDIEKNELFLIRSGPITPAIYASSAMPPFFSPVKLYGRTLVDGGVIAPVPVDVARSLHPKVIISVDITAPPPKRPLVNMLDLTYRSIWIYYYELARMQSSKADIDIHPKLDGHGTFDDDQKEQLYAAGVEAAEKVINKIKKKLRDEGIPLKNKNNH